VGVPLKKRPHIRREGDMISQADSLALTSSETMSEGDWGETALEGKKCRWN